jgi:outer membrane immunogenic protein
MLGLIYRFICSLEYYYEKEKHVMECIMGKKVVVSIFFIGLIISQASIGWTADTTAASAYNWTGFHVGVNAGYGLNSNNDVTLQPVSASFVPVFTAGDVASPELKSHGFLGGGQIGYDYQFTKSWLVGVEADLQLADIHDSSTGSTPGVPGFVPEQTYIEQKLKWLGTFRGRLGALPIDTLLVYVTGGLAYGESSKTATISFPSIPQLYSGHKCLTQPGGVAGGGIEWAFWKNVSIKVEYLYYSLSTDTVTISTVNGPSGTASAQFDTKGSIIRTGLNYKF